MNGQFYLRIRLTKEVRRGEEEARLEGVEGVPSVARQWNSFLLKESVHGKVVEKLTDGRGKIDLGADDGLKAGMEMLVEDEVSSVQEKRTQFGGRRYGIIRLIAVEAHRSTVEVKNTEFFHGLKKGQRVSSRIPNEIIAGESGTFFWW
jgi:hypothetical protein